MTTVAGETFENVGWAELIPVEQWAVYARVIKAARGRGIKFALGGGFAFSHYANRWRNTKDMDFYVMPADRDAMIEVVGESGMVDYFEVHDYDRNWIFRSHDRHGIIVDIMWQMANYRAQVDEGWLTRGAGIRIRGVELRLLPVEELLWAKLYVMQRERCDWGDLLNILHEQAGTMDWDHLMGRVGEDRRVVAALMELFAWTCPDRAVSLPAGLWGKLGIEAPAAGRERLTEEASKEHVRLLDSRDWFGPNRS